MTHSTQELLQRHGINFVPTKKGKFTTKCPNCLGGYLNVEQKRDAVVWFCHQCGQGGCEKFEQRTGKSSGELGPIKAVFDYTDEASKLLFQVLRFEPIGQPKQFRQRTDPDQKKWSIKGVRIVPFRLPELMEDIGAEHVVFIVEGEKDVNTLRDRNIPATTNPMGAGKWWPEFNEILRGADVVICGDNDQPGRDHVALVAKNLHGVVKRLRVLDLKSIWPEIEESDDITDWFKAGHSVEELWSHVDALIEQVPERDETPPAQTTPKSKSHKGNGAAPLDLEPWSIERVLEVFKRWLIFALDENKSPNLTPVYAVLGTIAANLLPGDAVWLGLVAPPSSAKTEILNSVSTLPYVYQAATVTPAALLSGVPKKQHHKTAVGGLLRQIGEFGIISLKDFGSILSMRPDAKAEVLAALREVYDGAWTRLLGTEGGRTLSWSGKVGLVFGCTGVIDGHYSVIGAMGDRFLLSRLAPGEGQFGCALKHSGAATGQMRKELAEAVAHLFAGERPDPRPLIEGGEEFQRLDRIVSLVVRMRGAVERDRQSREIEAIYGAEGTARLGLTLERLLAGLDTLRIDRAVALDVVETVAMDSVPPLRRRAYEYLRSLGCHAETPAIAKVLGLPTVTVRRGLEDLAAYQLVERTAQGQGKPDLWGAT